MVSYTDKIIGKILAKLDDLEIADNTIVIFTGDNGTNKNIVSQTRTGDVRGGKGNTIDAGTRVPLVIHYPNGIKEGRVYNGLVEFSDFFPTLAEIAGVQAESDGQSLYGLLSGSEVYGRETAFVHYDPRWLGASLYRNRFVRTTRYKLYQDGRYFDLSKDVLEQSELNMDSLTLSESEIRDMLQLELDRAPEWK